MLTFNINEDERVNTELPGLTVIYNSFVHQDGKAYTYCTYLPIKQMVAANSFGNSYRYYGFPIPILSVCNNGSVRLMDCRLNSRTLRDNSIPLPTDIGNPQRSLRIKNELGS